jgi:hypothetical protein
MTAHAMYKVACCFYNAAKKALTEADLYVPERGGPDHRGIDAACCDSMTVWWDTTTAVIQDDPCSDPKTRDLVIYYSGKACTEGKGVDTPCGPVESPCINENGDCPEPDPLINIGGKCSGERPTVQQETAAVWAIRSVLEDEVACNTACCLRDCAEVRCKVGSFSGSSGITEGGCFFIEVRIAVTL